RRAIGLSLNSERLAINVLNDGSNKALGFVPTGFTNQETQKDFAEELGVLNPSEREKAKELWQPAKKELGIDKAELTFL
ncbi:peptide ABC transporter substrate-binding protein, partial [Enterococcus faecalis]